MSEKSRFCTIAKILPFAITTAFKAGPFLLIFLFFTTILSGLMPTATVYAGKLVLNAIVDVVKMSASHGVSGSMACALTIQLIVLLVAALLSQTSLYLSYFIGKRLSLNISADVIRKASTLDYTFFENPRFYDMMTRARLESSGKPLILILKITSIVSGGITFFSMGGMVASFSLLLFIAMLFVCLPLLLVQLRYGEKNYSLQYGRTEDMRLAQYTSGIMMAREHVPEILSFGLWEYLFKKWYTASQKFFYQDIQLANRRTIAETMAVILITISTSVATGNIVYICAAERLTVTVGEIMMYSGAFAGGLVGLRTAMEGVSGIYENALFLSNLLEFNKLDPHIEIRQIGRMVPSAVKSIELRNVSFRYPDSQRYAIKNINATFNWSESTLIVGANGAGKTTLIKLLTRLYDPTEGRILLNGVDIREFEIESLRKTIGIIFQEFIRYAFSAKANIGCGDMCDFNNMEKIIAAAKLANAESFIEQFPRQYDTILSRLFKDGQELSLGQWQRVSLARLFMKDAPVFILDEPTASLDVETEAHLLQEITELSRNKICILVSHRMFREGIADRVIVLDKGQIAEAGTYRSLITKNGEFARLWRLYHNLTKQ